MTTEQAAAQPGRDGRRVGGDDAFFTGAGRKTLLEQLRHLSQWSRRVLLVTGAAGAGKTVLYRQFSATLEARAKAARIEAALVRSPRELLQAMVQGFGLAAPADADVELLSELIAAHAADQQESDRHCVVLVDDAEQLDARALDRLLQLAADAPLRVVLFGEVRLVPAVERVARAGGTAWHEIRLAGLDAQEVREYLTWWFRRDGGMEELPLDDGQVRQIARLSEGLPGRIEQMARVLLAKMQSQGQAPSPRHFPRRHGAVAAALVAVILLVYLVWPGGSGDDTTRVEQVEVPPPRAAQTVEAPAAADATAPQRASGRTEPARPAPAPAADPPASAARAPEPVPQAIPEPDPEPAPIEEPAPAARAPAEQRPREQAPAAASRPAETPAAEAPPAPPPAAPVPAQPVAAGARGADWIMSQPASAYTLQLVSFSTEERAREYLAGQAEPERFAAFRQQRDGRILHVIVYGRFDSRADAERAAAALPAEAGRVQPWIRSFADVQAAVRTALQRQ